MSTEQPPGFLEAVTKWARANGYDGATVTAVEPYGTDWDGDTEGGFYSSFTVSVRTVNLDGTKGYIRVEGELLNSLWDAVVRGYTAN